ncbi:MAG: hypothetical protein WAL22_02900 [Solirubrobacteraceae bacterium]
MRFELGASALQVLMCLLEVGRGEAELIEVDLQLAGRGQLRLGVEQCVPELAVLPLDLRQQETQSRRVSGLMT